MMLASAGLGGEPHKRCIKLIKNACHLDELGKLESRE